MDLLRYGLYYIKKRKFLCLSYVLLGILVTVLVVMLTYITGTLVDLLSSSESLHRIMQIIFLLTFTNIIIIVINYITGIIYSRMQVDIAYNISCDVVQHIHKAEIKRLNNMNSAYLNQRISQDAGSVIKFTLQTITLSLKNGITITLCLVILFKLSIMIAIVVLVSLMIYVFLYTSLRKVIFLYSNEIKEKQSIYFGQMNEQLHLSWFVKVHSLHDFFKNRLRNAYTMFQDSFMRYQKFSQFFLSLDKLVMGIAQIVVYYICVIEIFNGNIALGSFVIIAGYFKQLMNAISYYFNLGRDYQESLVSYQRINELMKWDIEQIGENEIQTVESIKFENFGFSYNENALLGEIQLEFHKGKLYSFSGRNGVGKTTLILSLMGLFTKEMEGNIYINNLPIEQIDMVTLRKKIFGYSDQASTVIYDSIKNNLELNNESNNKLKEIVEILGLNHYINNSPAGLDSIINEQSKNISGGEKQKISIARALLKDSQVLILDEPTSAMDLQSISRLLNYLHKLKLDKIIILVSHDSNVLKECDVNYTLT
ncbi:ATP-binding cassette domain-containing protein [Paenibacillus sp. FSL K6-0108]|uniref:ATP-binding cassette domain-containing protein n=1 Tax=Paenibacillus sp. FSL K6-0108 TaxID=2921417 RepID=UPI00324CE976